MAEQGVRFTRFYSAALVVASTRGSCLTGFWDPFRYGIYSANTGHLLQEKKVRIATPLDTIAVTLKMAPRTLTKTSKTQTGEALGSRHFQLHRCTDSMRACYRVSTTFDQ